MNLQEKNWIGKLIITILIVCLSIFTFLLISNVKEENNDQILGRIYFNKPVSWECAYAYLYDNNRNELIGTWPGIELNQEEDYIYYLEITKQMLKNPNDLNDCKVIFNNGIVQNDQEQYRVETNCEGFGKIYNITKGLGELDQQTIGEWIDYNEHIKIGKIPTTENKIKNVIYMIGDGMGENHIIAGALYKGEKLNIQNIKNKSYVTTASISTVTDSAAGATALATGYKTINGFVGKDKYGNDVENLIEYTNSKGLKTGIACTQILNHATPAAFSVHNIYRYNYDEIVQLQIESCVDIMFGGGRNYFSKYESKMADNNYKWINDLSELENINKNEKIIGTFASESISKEKDRISLANMTKEALSRLENDNGFFLMVEGSDIDVYSHESNMSKMLTEMIDFDDAVGVAMEYVNNNQDTLLVVTADHETGGLTLDGVTSSNQLNNSLFTSEGQHTNSNVIVYAYGIGARDITQYDIIDNTSIYKFIKQAITNNYER